MSCVTIAEGNLEHRSQRLEYIVRRISFLSATVDHNHHHHCYHHLAEHSCLLAATIPACGPHAIVFITWRSVHLLVCLLVVWQYSPQWSSSALVASFGLPAECRLLNYLLGSCLEKRKQHAKRDITNVYSRMVTVSGGCVEAARHCSVERKEKSR